MALQPINNSNYSLFNIIHFFFKNLWPAMYLAYVVEPGINDSAWREISSICERDKELRSKAQRLRRQLIDLERDAIAKGRLDSPSSTGTTAVFD